MAHNKPDNCLVQRDGASYVTLRDGISGLILHDRQGVGGGSISGSTFSRRRWNAMQEEEERQHMVALAEHERELAAQAKAKIDEWQRAQAAVRAKHAAEQAKIKEKTVDMRDRNRTQGSGSALDFIERMKFADRLKSVDVHKFMKPKPE